MLKEFKKFAMKGNVMDMAIGVIIGGAFGKIVSSLVADIIMPPLGFLTRGINLTNLKMTLKSATAEAPALTLNYGTFINTIIDFLIISFSIFIVIRQINKLKKKEEAKPVSPSEEILLLREIRDSLKK
ncbi:MAG: large-conductance mechanosensitive channel protein MscL [Patescibacteria group bacterium]|jgi:large conductance mechanosensitive channel|nr:large-conductance mechanosensitive channel protein MscL [Candidatus Magasanikbacteria bacterium]HQL52696.1 large-conductance mechanosensitive channel protein MscL [Candidatus Magasanikbacteria bacterium]